MKGLSVTCEPLWAISILFSARTWESRKVAKHGQGKQVMRSGMFGSVGATIAFFECAAMHGQQMNIAAHSPQHRTKPQVTQTCPAPLYMLLVPAPFASLPSNRHSSKTAPPSSVPLKQNTKPNVVQQQGRKKERTGEIYSSLLCMCRMEHEVKKMPVHPWLVGKLVATENYKRRDAGMAHVLFSASARELRWARHTADDLHSRTESTIPWHLAGHRERITYPLPSPHAHFHV